MNWNLFKDMLAIDSTSGKERKMAQWLLEHLEAPSKQSFEVGDGTLNLLLSWGTPQVVFCTHMDTVPPYIEPSFPETLPPAELRSLRSLRPLPCPGVDMSSGGSISGRGSCDAKGQIFAMYTACKELEASGCTNFGLLLLAGEETGSWGAKAFSKTGFEAPFLIVGEPTKNKMVSASKGTLSYDLKFTGKAFHSGYPQYGVSAVELFNDFYNKLKAVDWGVDPELGETTWNIGLVHSDNPQNILAPELTCLLYFRTTFLSHQAVQEWMAPFLKEGGTQVALQSDRPEAAGDNRGQSPLGKICASARGTGDTPAHYVTLPGFESAPVAFGSDAPHLTGFGHKIICGPGSIRYAHRPDEHILVQDLENAVDIYKRLYATLLTN